MGRDRLRRASRSRARGLAIVLIGLPSRRMPQHVQGVVARAKGEPVSMETIVVPDPAPGEAVVTIQACGVCHTDLHYREGGINDDFPFLLGHEAAGIVESIGEG